MAISKIYKGVTDRDDIIKIYKGSELIYEKQSGPPDIGPYLTFKSTSSFTLNVRDSTKHWDGTLEYSTDTTTWSIWDGTTTLSSVANKLYLRGSNNTLITDKSSYNLYRWVLTGTNIDCIGNIENLLDYVTVTNGNHPPMATNCYYRMFSDCKALITAPQLPALTLADGCYAYMFYDCTNLTTAPELPANTLKNRCYNNMFYGCTAFKVSTTKTGSYQHSWRITNSTGTNGTEATNSMLRYTGGTYTGYTTEPYSVPIRTTYYVENAPV